MKISRLEIHNYRNLDGIQLTFADDCNFIVGENNLGKSNLLSLINILFSSRAFRFDDFKDPSKPIEIHFSLKLTPIEIGHFQDLFDLDDYSAINIVVRQLDIDDNINFYHLETDTFISPQSVRSINFIHYDSLRNPISELSFNRNRGVGKFLQNVISKYLETHQISNSDFLNQENIPTLLKAINEKFAKIKSFEEFGIVVTSEDEIEDLLSKILVFKDGKGDRLSKSGYGVQFLILITLSILEKLHTIHYQRGERGIFEEEGTGKKTISLVLGLDEPEIHLHPYMQRSLIKYLNAVVNNKNSDFSSLIKELFDIDEFVGQIIVVTHSPNIIFNDYKQIVRFYSEENNIKTISGNQISLDPKLQKHLYLHFPFIKEAFFSRCAIFVEGDSEFGSFPLFGQALSIEFDDLGICVIQAGGDSIPQLLELAGIFGIPAVGITDDDDGSRSYNSQYYFKTTQRDFESELISLVDLDKEHILRKIMCEYDSQGVERAIDSKALNKRAVNKYNIVTTSYNKSLKLKDIDESDLVSLKAFYITWFSINKSYPLGLLIGQNLSKDDIPDIYKIVIQKAKELIENAQ